MRHRRLGFDMIFYGVYGCCCLASARAQWISASRSGREAGHRE
jgi:hypothetical protein